MISIIIPVYNTELYIAETIESIQQQTFTDWELILVDDGSKDQSLDICRHYEQIDFRIHAIHKENGGMSSARDAGFKVANKDSWVLFFDADDVMAPSMLEHLWQFKDYDMVLDAYDDVNTDIIKDTRYNIDDSRYRESTGIDILNDFRVDNDFVGVVGNLIGVLFKREYWNKVYEACEPLKSRFPQNYLNDAYVIPRALIGSDRVVLCNNILFHHRISANCDSRQLKPNALAYELLDVQTVNVELYREHLSAESYAGALLDYMLVILKLWYQIERFETDGSIKNSYQSAIAINADKYWAEIKKIRYKGIRRILIRETIHIFMINHSLWLNTVAAIRYGVGYKK